MAGVFSWYHSTGAVPTALREREDDILPYSDGTKRTRFWRKNVTGRVREAAGLV